MLNIRNERESDYKNVEDITRKAFYQCIRSGMYGALSCPYHAGT